ncbi:GSCFA domain-containing protein [Flavobacteriaceae bacterium]|nr:GSCFA domain-containing protein [Flavobacteriaceae bacterium]
MKLTTPIKLSKQNPPINYSSKVLLLGSCFAQNMGAKLEYYKFQQCTNPFGILFHPVAIEKLITRAVNQIWFTSKDVFLQNEQWHCFLAHSKLSNTSEEDLISALNSALEKLRFSLLEASHVVFTFGTAWVYRHLEKDTIVVNCHKVPQKEFVKQLLSPDDVSDVLLGIETKLRAINPTCSIINTVSPVRHIKDGLIANSRSKAHLIAGVQEIVSPEKLNYYFPSYEIMMDELRDYRYYKEDLIHPNQTAIAIIWNAFTGSWICPETAALQKKIATIQSGMLHTPFNENSKAHIHFKKDLEVQISQVQKALPWATFL